MAPKSATSAGIQAPRLLSKAMEVPINTGETAAHKVFGRTANIQTVSLEGEVGVSIIETQTSYQKDIKLLFCLEKTKNYHESTKRMTHCWGLIQTKNK
jgi:hypothetical protein